ncbi:alpha/beta fold hydrolase [Nocardia sp. NPDC101769]|uniref:alpha/beta fold hydrolase n=1 Tax=Nocardia sp. NPDC101769 TaxID=3364333 RepID=UPI00382C8E95
MEKIWSDLPDGLRSPIRVVGARQRGATPPPVPAPVLVVIPGMGVPAAYYELFAQATAGRGYNVAICELRGQGDCADVGGTYGYHTIASVDLPAMIGAVAQRFPGSDRYLLGHSIGGQLAALTAAAWAEVSGLILVASGTNYYRCYGRAMSAWLLLGSALLPSRSSLVAADRRIGTALGLFDGHPKQMHSDWSQLVRSGRFELKGADVDYEARIGALEVPVLAVHIAGDELAPRASAEHFVEKFQSAAAQVWMEPRRVGHNGWILDGRSVLDRIEDWLQEVRAANAARSITQGR